MNETIRVLISKSYKQKLTLTLLSWSNIDVMLTVCQQIAGSDYSNVSQMTAALPLVHQLRLNVVADSRLPITVCCLLHF